MDQTAVIALADEPWFALFDAWFREAAAREALPDAMTLAISERRRAGRRPRDMVLLKDHGPDGFVFYDEHA